MLENTRSLMFDSGHTVSGICSRISRCISASSSTQRTPWSMRWAPSRSSASLMYAAGPSSPACATTRKFSSRASSNTALNLLGGLPASELSRPTAPSHGRNGTRLRRVSSADSGLRCRRKHGISRELIPSRFSASTCAPCSPVITVSSGTSRRVCVCGSKNSSTWRTPSCAAR